MNDLRLNEFLGSDMLLGSNDSKIIAGWFEFLYISKVNENVYKIGKNKHPASKGHRVKNIGYLSTRGTYRDH